VLNTAAGEGAAAPFGTPACRAANDGRRALGRTVVPGLALLRPALAGGSPDQRIPSGKRFTTTVCTPSSSTSTNAVSPSGPKAPGIDTSSAEKVPR